MRRFIPFLFALLLGALTVPAAHATVCPADSIVLLDHGGILGNGGVLTSTNATGDRFFRYVSPNGSSVTEWGFYLLTLGRFGTVASSGLNGSAGAPMAPQPATALHAEMRVSADRRRVSERRSSAMVDSLGEEVWGDASCAVALARPCPFKHRRSPKLSLQLFDGRAYFSAEPEGAVGRWIASQLAKRRTAGPAGDRTQSAT